MSKYLVSPLFFNNMGWKCSIEKEMGHDQRSPSLLLMEEVRVKPDLWSKTWRGENMKIFQKYQEVGIFIGTAVLASLTSQNEN